MNPANERENGAGRSQDERNDNRNASVRQVTAEGGELMETDTTEESRNIQITESESFDRPRPSLLRFYEEEHVQFLLRDFGEDNEQQSRMGLVNQPSANITLAGSFSGFNRSANDQVESVQSFGTNLGNQDPSIGAFRSLSDILPTDRDERHTVCVRVEHEISMDIPDSISTDDGALADLIYDLSERLVRMINDDTVEVLFKRSRRNGGAEGLIALWNSCVGPENPTETPTETLRPGQCITVQRHPQGDNRTSLYFLNVENTTDSPDAVCTERFDYRRFERDNSRPVVVSTFTVPRITLNESYNEVSGGMENYIRSQSVEDELERVLFAEFQIPRVQLDRRSSLHINRTHLGIACINCAIGDALNAAGISNEQNPPRTNNENRQGCIVSCPRNAVLQSVQRPVNEGRSCHCG